MKKCHKCGLEKSMPEFSLNKSRKDGRSSHCKACHKLYRDSHYARTKERYLELTKVRNLKRRKERFIWLLEYYKTHPCVDCGEDDPEVLDFDHRDETKTYGVSKIFVQHAWETVLAEIAKCDVRCANCHRKRTAKQFKWYENYR